MAKTVVPSRYFNNQYSGRSKMSCKDINGTKRRRCESSTSEASRMSTNTQMTNLSLGSSQDDNNVFNDRRESVISDTNNAKLFELPIVDRQSNIKNDAREKRIAMRKTYGQRVVFSNDETDGPSEETRDNDYPFENGHREFITKPKPLYPRQRYASYTEGSINTNHHPDEEPLLHHSVTVPYQMQPHECTCCERQQQLAQQQYVRQYDQQQTYTKSPSVRSLPDSYIHNVRMNNQMNPQRRNSGVPIDTVVTLKQTGDGTYLHPVCRMPNVRSPRSHSFDILDTIPSGDSAGSTLENRPLPLRPVVDPSDQRLGVAYYEPVKENTQALVLPSVSSKGSSDSSRSRNCFRRNKFLVLVILNALLILVIISAVPFYLFVVVGGQPIQEGPQQTSLQFQQQHRSQNCIQCSVLTRFYNIEDIKTEWATENGTLCCLKAEISIVEFMFKTRMLQTSDVTAPDDENNHGRPIIQLQSRDLEGRFVRWHAENGDQTFRRPGLRLLDDRKIKFEKDGYFFVSTKLAFTASDQGIIRAQFTVMVKEETDKYFKPFCEQNETLSNQYGGRYVSDCNFVHHFTSGSLIYVQLDHVEGMQKNDGKIMIFYLGL